MTEFNIAEIHSIGMYALSSALDRILDEQNDDVSQEFRGLLLEMFELNFYRCLVHNCPEHTISVKTMPVGEEQKQLLLD